GEHVGAALVLEWRGERPSVPVLLAGPEGTVPRAFLPVFVPGPKTPLADPLLGGGRREVLSATLPNQRSSHVLLDWHVPVSPAPGERKGTLFVEGPGGRVEVPVLLRIEEATIPDRPTFVLSLNTYGFPCEKPEGDLAWFRLAHEHRATLAPVPYSQSG